MTPPADRLAEIAARLRVTRESFVERGRDIPVNYSAHVQVDSEWLLAELARVTAENATLRERLLAANGLLRSAYQIATREDRVPNSTNWDGFALQLSKELALQHEITGPMWGERARAALRGTEET